MTSGNTRLRCCYRRGQLRCVSNPGAARSGARLTDYQTRITTKYKIPNLNEAKYQQKLRKRKRDADGNQDEKEGSAAAQIPRATLTLKTYDPESGVVLKFKTDRAAEVGRLIHGLGRVGRHMAALPEKAEGSKRGTFDHGSLTWLIVNRRCAN